MRYSALRPLILAVMLATLPLVSRAGVAIGISVNIAPPVLPVYVQPAIPGPGYIWTPGYWAWGDDGYYWVPGTWVLPPAVGLLWTPGWWGWGDGAYVWHAGYWGPRVGFYGGVNYGYGYPGVGFVGGYWRGHDYFYNRAVANIGSVHITNVYNKTVINNVTVNRVSYNGGTGGLTARPTGSELAAEHDRHTQPTLMQRQHVRLAASDRDLRASVNGGRPAVAATARPAMFRGHGVEAAHASDVRNDRPPRVENRAPAPQHMDRPPEAQRSDRPPQAQRSDRPPENYRSTQTPHAEHPPQVERGGGSAMHEPPAARPEGHENRGEPHPQGHPQAHEEHREEH
jgi:hypothetical protein